jgi:MFS family permease
LRDAGRACDGQVLVIDEMIGRLDAARPRVPAGQVTAVLVGNALEFYDFLTYAFFAVQIGQAFFPAGNPTASLLASLATFGAGFLMRPIGGLVIGRMGDRVGRKPAMVLSFGCMGVAMIGLALTPSYASIGIAAPILVIAFRLLQGFALGGDVGPTTAYLLEIAPPARRGFYASLQIASQGAAILLAGIIGVVLARTLEPQALHDWGWRIAFLIGTVIVPFGLVIRRRLPETLDRYAADDSPSAGVHAHRRLVLLGLGMLGSGTIMTYVLAYLNTFATVTLHMQLDVAFGATVIMGLCDVCLAPVSGWLSDRYGRKPVMLIPWLLLFVLVIPAFVLITRLATPAALLGATTVLAILRSLGTAPIIAALTEGLPARVRSGSLALTYALAVATFGGTAQFMVTWLMAATGSRLAPGWYMMTALGCGLIAMALMRETAPVRATPAGFANAAA